MTEFNFDEYMVTGWLQNGLFVPVGNTARKSLERVKIAVHAVFAVSVMTLSLACASIELPQTVQQSAVSDFRYVGGLTGSEDVDTLRPGYWRDLAQLLSTLPRLPDDAEGGPLPIF